MKAASRVLLTIRMIAKSIVTPFRPFAVPNCKAQTRVMWVMPRKDPDVKRQACVGLSRQRLASRAAWAAKSGACLVSQIRSYLDRFGFLQPVLLIEELREMDG